MKRFTTLALLTVVLSFGVTLLSHASTDNVVKTESVTHSDLLSVTVYESNYIAEATQEVIADYTPNTIGKETDGYKSPVYHPPAFGNKNLILYSRRW